MTADGQGRFFDSKAEAMAEVEILMTQGVRNIDVGCMQVNLLYHAGAFENLAEAFDPGANTAYAAAYLKSMFQSTGDWRQAAGFYHSTTPERNGPYRDKVLGFWRQMAGNAALPSGRPAEPAWAGPAVIDHARMARLNASFKSRRDQGRTLMAFNAGADDAAALRTTQLRDWREAAKRSGDTSHLLAMRQAEQELRRKRLLDQAERDADDLGFEQRRAKQLYDWRTRVAGAGITVIPFVERAAPEPAPR